MQQAVYIAHFASRGTCLALEKEWGKTGRIPLWLDYLWAYALPDDELQALRLRQQRRVDGRPLGFMYWGPNG